MRSIILLFLFLEIHTLNTVTAIALLSPEIVFSLFLWIGTIFGSLCMYIHRAFPTAFYLFLSSWNSFLFSLIRLREFQFLLQYLAFFPCFRRWRLCHIKLCLYCSHDDIMIRKLSDCIAHYKAALDYQIFRLHLTHQPLSITLALLCLYNLSPLTSKSLISILPNWNMLKMFSASLRKSKSTLFTKQINNRLMWCAKISSTRGFVHKTAPWQRSRKSSSSNTVPCMVGDEQRIPRW